MASEVLTALEC